MYFRFREVSQLLALAMAVSLFAPTAEAEQRLSRNEISRLIVGRTVSWSDGGQSTYQRGGKYHYAGRGLVSEGSYVITDGGVCMKFNNGRLRCDGWYREGDGYYIQTTREQGGANQRPSSRYSVVSIR